MLVETGNSEGGGGQSLSFQLVHAEVCYLKRRYKPYYVILFNGYDSSAYVGYNHATDEISSAVLMEMKLHNYKSHIPLTHWSLYLTKYIDILYTFMVFCIM